LLFSFVVFSRDSVSWPKKIEDATWPCVFTDGSTGNVYDLTSQSGNTGNTDGPYNTTDSFGHNYYFKLCDPTTDVPGQAAGQQCQPNTQVCQLTDLMLDISCGVGPPSVSFFDNQSGLKMTAINGDIGCGTTRTSVINVLCPSEHSRNNNDIDLAVEATQCNYEITLYIDSACSGDLCCTYQSGSTTIALCSTPCPVVAGFTLTHSTPITDCDSCAPFVNPLSCCLYEDGSGDFQNNCSTTGTCPTVDGYSLISQYSTSDCDQCTVA